VTQLVERPSTGAVGAGPGARGGRRDGRRRGGYRALVGLAGLGVVVIGWQLAALALHDAALLPTVPDTVADFDRYVHEAYPTGSRTLLGHAAISLRRVVLGFALGAVAGLVLGSTMAAWRVVRYAIDPILTVLRPVPPLAFIPLFIVWLGVDEAAKIGLIMLGTAPIVATATLGALDAVPRSLEQASRSLGASAARTLLLVRLRAALPALITGLRLALGGAWSSIIAAELVGATEGIGFVTLAAGNYLQTTLVLSGIVLIAVLGLATDGFLRLALRFADPSVR
jgi:NitT/TauT family transport system permease protein/taurine transport system permease protein